MVRHHGNAVELILRGSNKSMAEIARELGITRKTLYNSFAKEVLPKDFLERLGKVVDLDFESLMLNEYDDVASISSFEQPEGEYVKMSPLSQQLSVMTERLLIDYGDMLAMLLSVAAEDETGKIGEDIHNFVQILLEYQDNECFHINMKDDLWTA